MSSLSWPLNAYSLWVQTMIQIVIPILVIRQVKLKES